MPFELPLVTRHEIARDFRLADMVTETSAIRSLRTKNALSNGLTIEMRGPAGRLGGRLHLYSALNRDAARAVRRDDMKRAIRLAKAAASLERSTEAKRLANAVAAAGVISNAGGLARALSVPSIANEVAVLQQKHDKARARIAKELARTVLVGHVSDLLDATAILSMPHHGPLTVPRVVVDEAGVGAIGAAVSVMWEVLPGGRTMITFEPAVDSPDVSTTGEPLVDVYGTPWGRILTAADADKLAVVGGPTVTIPAGIPDVR
jgi:hypothetical protein